MIIRDGLNRARNAFHPSLEMTRPRAERQVMERSLKDLNNYVVSATDGDIGTVADFLLDHERWVIDI